MVDRRFRVVLICLSLFFCLLIDGTVEQRVSVNRQEWLALLQLRSSLGLRAREWPINSDPCTSWVGIRCIGDMVTGINISGFRRTRRGRQNPQLSIDALLNLTLLSSFNASNFALPGTIPEWMGLQLHALQVLDLSSCFINGSIPPTLGNLSSLLELHLSGNTLTGLIPSSLTQLTSLNVLNLSQNSLHGRIPATLAALGNLTLLDLSSNFLSGPIPPEIGTFSRLRSLNLSRNSFSSSFPPQLSGLSSLVDLDLGYNSLSGPLPSDLGSLRNLRVFIVGRNFLIGRLPDAFWSMPSLQFLDMSVNNFTGTLPTTTTPRAPNTTAPILNISHNLLYGTITPLITTFRFVDMSGNYFEGPVPSYALAAATSLDRNCLRNSTAQRSRADCASFYADRNLVFDNFGQPNVTQHSRPSTSTGRRLVVILASVFGGVGLVGLVLLIIWLFITCKRRRARAQTRPRGTTTTVEEPPIPAGGPTLDLPNLGSAFTYEKIIEATGEFGESNLLKNGHSGDLYVGVLDDEVPVVVKRFDVGSVGKDSYESEMEVLSKVSPHPRLVPLLGHCSEREEAKFLVYRRMPNGDLSRCLFRETGVEGSVQSLDWITRVKIAIGAAEALSYLHHECNPPLVHRDVQASSILLDDKYEVRLGSLSMVCAQEADVHQSRITKFLRLSQSSDLSTSGTPNATCSYDVYCFGKVLLELLTGNLGISSPLADPAASREWTDAALRHISVYDKELVTGILDPSLIIHDDLLDEMWAMAIVARSCLNPRPSRRPIMRYVLKALENPLKVVRDEQQHTGASSRGSWNGALFGSWRQSSSDAAAQPPEAVGATTSGVKLAAGGSSGRRRSHGNDSNNNNDGNNNGNSSSARKSSREIFPEPFVEGGI